MCRYALQFHRETDQEIRERKEDARKTLHHVSESGLKISIENYFTKELDFPKRPPWNFDMSREVLEAKENRYFTVSTYFAFSSMYHSYFVNKYFHINLLGFL